MIPVGFISVNRLDGRKYETILVLPSIPSVGQTVVNGDKTWTVRGVIWNLDAKSGETLVDIVMEETP